MSKQPDAMAMADAYANASFYQGLHQLTVYEEPEIARAKLDAELRRLHSLNAELEAELEAQQVYARVLCKAIDAATDFAGTVAGGASWWDDVWAEHYRACDAAREGISKAKEAQQ